MRMTVARNRVVSIEYTLTGADGSVIDTSRGDEPIYAVEMAQPRPSKLTSLTRPSSISI